MSDKNAICLLARLSEFAICFQFLYRTQALYIHQEFFEKASESSVVPEVIKVRVQVKIASQFEDRPLF